MGDYKQGLLDGQAREAPRITGALIVTTILGAAGAAQFGFAIAALNSPEGVIEKDLGLPPNGFPFSMAVAATSIAAIVGANLAGTLADKLGRRLFLVLCNFMFLVGGALCVGSGLLKAQQSAAYALLLVARAIIGLGVGAASAGCPLYLGEIAPSHLKGAYGSVGQFSVTLFIVVAEVLGIWMSTPGLWYWMLGFHAALGALSLLTAPWLLESPRWLVARGRVDEARKILTAIRGYTSDDSADAEIAEIQEASSGGGGGNGGGSMSVLDVLRDPVYRRPTLVACVLQLAQQVRRGRGRVRERSAPPAQTLDGAPALPLTTHHPAAPRLPSPSCSCPASTPSSSSPPPSSLTPGSLTQSSGRCWRAW